MIVRAAVSAIILVALIVIGLYAVPIAVENSGVIATKGTMFTIIYGSWESIPFSVAYNNSRLSGSISTSQSVSVFISRGGPLDNNVYEVANSSSFSLNVVLASGNYYLVFVSPGAEERSPPIYIQIESSIVLNS